MESKLWIREKKKRMENENKNDDGTGGAYDVN